MAAPVVTSRTIDDAPQTARFLFTGAFTDTQESAVTKVDISGLSGSPGTSGKVSIIGASWNVTSGSVAVLIGSTVVLQLSGSGKLSGEGLTITGAANDDVKFTTTGIASAGTYQIELVMRKQDGFSTVPILLSAEVAAGDYVTGQELEVVATFDKPVAVLGAAEIPITIDGTTVNASVLPGTSATTVKFRHVVKSSEAGELTEVTLGEIALKGGPMSLYGGSPAGPVTLASISPDITDVSVNKAPVVSSVALTDAHAGVYETGDVIEVTVTFDKTVRVSGTPQVELTITSGDKNADFVGYGTDQTELRFQYTVVEADVALATGFDIATGALGLNSGTIVNENAPAVDATLTLTASDTSGVTVN